MLRRGAFSEVWAGKDRDGSVVALKKEVLRVHAAPRTSEPGDVFREAELLRRLRHVNVVQLLDVQFEARGCLLVLEWCSCDLQQATRLLLEPPPEAAIKLLFADLLNALAACHAADVIHLDVKPNNLLFGRDKRLKLADFGNAVYVGTAEAARPGTRWYRAPELLYGSTSCTQGADMWSAGCVLAELLGNAPLCPGVSDVDQLAQIHATLGAPSVDERGWLATLPGYEAVTFDIRPGVCLNDALPDAPPGAMQLLSRLVKYVPSTRATADEALRDTWFIDAQHIMSRDELEQVLLPRDKGST